jgi:hypothetical protein
MRPLAFMTFFLPNKAPLYFPPHIHTSDALYIYLQSRLSCFWIESLCNLRRVFKVLSVVFVNLNKQQIFFFWWPLDARVACGSLCPERTSSFSQPVSLSLSLRDFSERRSVFSVLQLERSLTFSLSVCFWFHQFFLSW